MRVMGLVVAVAVLLGTATASAQQAAVDHWVLALSWSPAWCAGKGGESDAEQCGKGKRHAFIVHGLWPQFEAKAKPSTTCNPGAGVPKEVADKALPLMPSRQLIEHEWKRHGACLGVSPADYFGKTRTAAERVRIPAPFKAADKPLSMPVAGVEKLFAEANPGLGPKSIEVVCRNRQAAEVRICLDKDLKFRDCTRPTRNPCKGEVSFAPIK